MPLNSSSQHCFSISGARRHLKYILVEVYKIIRVQERLDFFLFVGSYLRFATITRFTSRCLQPPAHTFPSFTHFSVCIVVYFAYLLRLETEPFIALILLQSAVIPKSSLASLDLALVNVPRRRCSILEREKKPTFTSMRLLLCDCGFLNGTARRRF